MDKLIEQLPQIITAAAQSYLGILALLSVALAVLAYFFFFHARIARALSLNSRQRLGFPSSPARTRPQSAM